MAFIRQSGIRPLLDALRTHCEHGRPSACSRPPTRAPLSRAHSTRLHAKAWLFHRNSGFSTAYIGSSNLTHSAQVTGLEWNVRVSGARNPDVIDKVGAVFESYWASDDFVPYDSDEFQRRAEISTQAQPVFVLSPVELRPEPFQERLLEQIALARESGHHRNLLVSATGTGKTVMAALDYLRLRDTLPRARLLFVAHREEILDQSLATFRQGLRDHAFGEKWVAGLRPRDFEHVFASIQSLHTTGLASLPPQHFDVVIVDEFHHAAAPSYTALLEHVQPVELLGLTATPERSDGLPVLQWFDHRIAAELRLWDAIDQHRLAPFAYYGIHDGLDLRNVPWKRGRGYDVDGLTNVLTATDAWARLVLAQLVAHVDDVGRMRALGFCVSVEHARFMARVFAAAGVRATAIWGDSPEIERRAALADLAARRVNIVFSVDLFNEGIDVPAVDTLLLLRPTDSPTLFLQQLGRGLRRSAGKTACTVLDFVGRHRAEFRFDRRFRALLGSASRAEVMKEIERGFPFLPAGCHMELDRKASEIVLRNIREAVPGTWAAKVEELRSLAGAGAARRPVRLAEFLEATGCELEDLYAGGRTWSELCEAAGLAVAPPGPEEASLRRACGRLLHVDDAARIAAYRAFLARENAPQPGDMTERERRLLRMLVGSLVDKVPRAALAKQASLDEGCRLLWRHPAVRAELLELLEVLGGRISHVPQPLGERHADVPLVAHARYSRIEILAAFGVGVAGREDDAAAAPPPPHSGTTPAGPGARVAPWQMGVYWADEERADLLAFTLDKTSGAFSPTTRYRDYAVSRDLIHWESQNMVRADSPTGRRYQQHAAQGSSVMLFTRLRDDDRAFYFLGPATYVSHESERPMAITWRLEHPLPGDLFAAFAAAVA